MILYGIEGRTDKIFGTLNSFTDMACKIDKKGYIFCQLRQ